MKEKKRREEKTRREKKGGEIKEMRKKRSFTGNQTQDLLHGRSKHRRSACGQSSNR